MLRNEPENYKQRAREDVEASKKDIPEGFVMPTYQTAYKTEVEDDNLFSWSDSEAEDDFGGSDSDADMTFDEDDDEGAEEQNSDSDD